MQETHYFVLRPKSFIHGLLWFVSLPSYRIENLMSRDEIHVVLQKVKGFVILFGKKFLIYESKNYETLIFAEGYKTDKIFSQMSTNDYFKILANETKILEVILGMLFFFVALFALTAGSVKWLFVSHDFSKLIKAFIIFIVTLINILGPFWFTERACKKLKYYWLQPLLLVLCYVLSAISIFLIFALL